MALEDIRLKLSFISHPKRLRLRKRFGIEAENALFHLWIYAALNRQDGVLPDDEDLIELAANYDGEPGKLVPALVATGWLDRVEGPDGRFSYALHDWSEHQPHVAGHREFVEIQRERGRRSGDKRKKQAEEEAARVEAERKKRADEEAGGSDGTPRTTGSTGTDSGSTTGSTGTATGSTPTVPTNLPTVPTNLPPPVPSTEPATGSPPGEGQGGDLVSGGGGPGRSPDRPHVPDPPEPISADPSFAHTVSHLREMLPAQPETPRLTNGRGPASHEAASPGPPGREVELERATDLLRARLGREPTGSELKGLRKACMEQGLTASAFGGVLGQVLEQKPPPDSPVGLALWRWRNPQGYAPRAGASR